MVFERECSSSFASGERIGYVIYSGEKRVMNEECTNWSDVSMQNTRGWGLGELFVDSW